MQRAWIVIEGRETSTRKPESNGDRQRQYRNEDRPWTGPRRSSYRFALPGAFANYAAHVWTNCCHPSGRQRCVSHAANRACFARQPGSYIIVPDKRAVIGEESFRVHLSLSLSERRTATSRSLAREIARAANKSSKVQGKFIGRWSISFAGMREDDALRRE